MRKRNRGYECLNEACPVIEVTVDVSTNPIKIKRIKFDPIIRNRGGSKTRLSEQEITPEKYTKLKEQYNGRKCFCVTHLCRAKLVIKLGYCLAKHVWKGKNEECILCRIEQLEQIFKVDPLTGEIKLRED